MGNAGGNAPALIQCPKRGKWISCMVCHFCENHIKVLYMSEVQPELQCAQWDWSLSDEDFTADRNLPLPGPVPE